MDAQTVRLVPQTETSEWIGPRQAISSAADGVLARHLSQMRRSVAKDVIGIVYPMHYGRTIEGDVFDRELEPEMIRVLDAIPRPMPRQLLGYLALSALAALVGRKPGKRVRRLCRRKHNGQFRPLREMR
mgnify:CR=1 FL=1